MVKTYGEIWTLHDRIVVVVGRFDESNEIIKIPQTDSVSLLMLAIAGFSGKCVD